MLGAEDDLGAPVVSYDVAQPPMGLGMMEIHRNALRLELPPPAPACGGGTDEMQLVGGPVRVPKTDLMTPLNSRK